jgi:hypothetical protein
MQIKNRDENSLILELDFIEDFIKPVNFLLFFGFVFLIISTFANTADLSLFNFFLAILVLVILISIQGEGVYQCKFTKPRNTVIMVIHSPLMLWFPQSRELPLDNINQVKILLHTKTGRAYALAGKGTAEVAEAISQFLEIPLHVQLDSEIIIQIPEKLRVDLQLLSTPCPSCGAPLPKIEQNSTSVRCSHCDMTSIIRW